VATYSFNGMDLRVVEIDGDPSYSNRSFNAGRRTAREEYIPLFPKRTPAKWNGTLTLK